MRFRSVVAVGGALLLVATLAFVAWTQPIAKASDEARIVFVCRNGVAMSVWSAAYFNRLAATRALRERAVARASVPSFRAVPFPMTLALALDGFRVGDFRPQVVDPQDVRTATLVVAIDTELPLEVRGSTSSHTEVWQGFPPMREEYFPSRAALKTRVEALVERIAAGADASPSTSERGTPAAR